MKVDFSQFTEVPLVDSLFKIGVVPEEIVHDKSAILAFLRSKGLEANEALV